MTTPLDEKATARDLLLSVDGTRADELRQSGALDKLLAAAPRLAQPIGDEIAKATDDVLSVNLVDVVAAGWKKYEALSKAARRTLEDPSTRESVVMVTHTIESKQHASVELYVDGTSRGTMEMTLRIAFTLAGVIAVVEQGRLTAITTGNCTVAGSLTVADVEAANKKRTFDLPGAIRLSGGIPLVETYSYRR